MAADSKGEQEFFKQKCLNIQAKMFELAKEGKLTAGIYRSLMDEDILYGSAIRKRLEEKTKTFSD